MRGFVHTVIIKQCDYPAIRVPVDQVFHIATHLHRRRIIEDVRKHVRSEGRDAFIMAQ